MPYYAYHFSVAADQRDLLLALLSALPFESFEEPAEGLSAFLPPSADREALHQDLAALAGRIAFQYRVDMLPDRNWNRQWEANFPPIRVGDFCGVRAGFHAPMAGVRYELVIDPEMAFGTGHHATTSLMLEAMETLDLRGKRVLDYGCGTGILAILADQLEAIRVDALDVDAAAYNSTRRNAVRNGAAGVRAWHGTLEDLPNAIYDLVLANINRNVILDSLPALYKRASAEGLLLASGFLSDDVPEVLAAARRVGFQLRARRVRGEWVCLALKR